MRALQLFGVLAIAKLVVIAGRGSVDWTAVLYLWQDAALALVFAGIDRVVRRPWLGWIGYGVLAGYTALNVAVVNSLSAPLTLHMLSATDVALSDSIAHYVTWKTLGTPLLVVGWAAGMPFVFRSAARRFAESHPVGSRFAKSQLLGALAGAGVLLVLLGPWLTGRVTAARPCNAVVALLASAVPRIAAAPSPERDWRRVRPATLDPSLVELRGRGHERNVVLVILESVGARYLQTYGAADDPMPNLSRLAERSLVFDNAYAVYPESIKGLVAVQFSQHPAMDTSPKQYRRPPVPALGEVLTRSGYDTALFHSGRFEYLGMDDVISGAGYGTTRDAGDITGNHRSSFGVDEAATVDALLTYVDRPRLGPFFVAYMPVAGHHPYDSPEAGPFDASTVIGAYRNAIWSADRAIRRLVDGLRKRRLWKDTMFVVIGDHGQAFGQHEGNFGHTFFLYDENVHVPFFVVLPGVVEREIRSARVASHVDLAPTVLDLLGLGAPTGYEGRSLLRPETAMALLFTDYAQAFVGLRDGRFKFVHEVESGRSLLFDVDADPLESIDLGPRHPSRVRDYRDHVLAWAAAQRDAVGRWPGRPEETETTSTVSMRRK